MTDNEIIGNVIAALRYERSVLEKEGKTRASMAITDYIQNAPDESFRRLYDLLIAAKAKAA